MATLPLSAKASVNRLLVTDHQVRQYAEAIDDRNPAYYDGSMAPPGFAVVPILSPVVEARRTVTGAPGLHGEHDLRIHAPLRPGMEVTSEAWVAGVWPTPAGLTVIVKVVTRERGVTLLNEQFFSVLVPGESGPDGYGECFPQHRMPDGLNDAPPIAERRYGLDLTLGRRYAKASGDFSPYTFDEEAARSRGLPGIIVGGICTLSFAARAAVEALGAGNASALRRIALRFSKLLILSDRQELSFRFWHDPTEAEGTFHFEAYDRGGDRVANHGLVELTV